MLEKKNSIPPHTKAKNIQEKIFLAFAFRFISNAIHKCLVITILLLTYASGISAQDLNKKITIKVKKLALEEVIRMVAEQGQINFSYSPQSIPVDAKVSIKAKNKPIREILDEIFSTNNIEYKIVENQVILRQITQSSSIKKEDKKNIELPKHTISGYLKDKTTGEVLIGAYSYIKGASVGTTSNAYGFYSLTLPEGKYSMVFSFIGYIPIYQEIDLKENKKSNIELEIAKLDIKEIEVKAADSNKVIRQSQLSLMKISPHLLAQLPGFVGDVDVIKSLQVVPGIKSYGDGSTLFYVRGGNSDQNLILLDETPIFNPSHLFGFFTSLAPDAIKDVQAYKGDFPAEYGNRLSSVIDIKSKDGNLKRFGFAGSISPFTSNVSVEGPFKKEKSSFFVSTRRANLGWLKIPKTADRILKVGFFDFNTKLNVKINDNNRLFFTFYGGKDDFTRSPGIGVNTFGISWNNLLGTLRWNHIFNARLFSNTTIYSSQYNYYLYTSKELQNYWNSSILNNSIKFDFTYFLNPKNTIKTGLEVATFYSNPGNMHISDTEVQKNISATPKYQSLQLNYYISNEQKIIDRITLRYGLRLPLWIDLGPTTAYIFDINSSVSDTLLVAKNKVYSKYFSPEPRININFNLTQTAALKASYNRTTQFIQLLSNSSSPFTSLEVWVPSGPNIKPQKSDQFAIGYFQQLVNKKIVFSSELFFRKFYNQIEYKDHANMLFNPLIEGQLRYGKATSYGIELMLQRTEGRFTGWVGYTYSIATKEIFGINNDLPYPAAYDRPHDFCTNISYNAKKHWSFSANWIYLTGAAISTPTSFFNYNGYTVPIYGEKNNDRLPAYHRLDLSFSYKVNKPERRFQHNFIFTLYNAYARKNPISVNFNKVMNDNGSIVVPSNQDGSNEIIPTTISVIGIIPCLTYNFRF